MRGVTLFKNQCPACRSIFPYPHLGDFTYGDFIFSGEQGTVTAYAYGLDNSAWDFIEALVPITSAGRREERAQVDLIQSSFAHFADTINEQRLVNRVVCPNCKNIYFGGSGNGERVGSAEIPVVTHSAFMALLPSERKERVLSYVSAQQAVQADLP